MSKSKENVPMADIEEGKVYLFEDGEVYHAKLNESFYINAMYKYETSYIDPALTSIVYDKTKEVKFSDKFNAMEFSNAGHFNRFLQQEGYAEVKRLAKMVGLKLKDK